MIKPSLALIALVMSPLALADSSHWYDDLQVNGFWTEGMFLTDDNNLYGNSETGSFAFHEIAANVSYSLPSGWLLGAQVMSRDAGEVDTDPVQLDYVLADYRFYDGENGLAGIKLGRIKNPFGFYNETRDVAFTRPSVMLPQSLYFDIARDLELSSDGVGLYADYDTNLGWVENDFIIGVPKRDASVEYAYLSADWPGRFDDALGVMYRALVNSRQQGLRFGTTLGYFQLGFDADEAVVATLPTAQQNAAPNDGDMKLAVAVLSAQYNLEHWSFTSEYGRQSIRWGELGGAFALDPNNVAESFYLQAEYRATPEWTWVVRYDQLFLDLDDRNGKKTEALFGKPAHTQYAKDLTLGVGWQPMGSRWLLRAELHHVKGTGWLPEQDNPDQNALKEDWNMLALQATYRF